MRSRREAQEVIWCPSPSPEHADASLRNARTASKIVNEEIDAWGKKKYEVQWFTTQSHELAADTTWEYLDSDDDFELIEDWEEFVTRKRRRLAHNSYEIPVPDGSIPLHGYPTFEAAHALEQKQKRSRRHPLSRYHDWDALQNDPHASSSSSLPAAPPIHQPQIYHVEPSPGMVVVKQEVPVSATGSIERIVRRKTDDDSNPRPQKKQKTGRPLRRTIPSLTPEVIVRDPVELSWSRNCKEAGAASISIVNAVNEEMSPPLPNRFRYIEGSYILSKGMSRPDPGFLVACNCTTGCDGEVCECQAAAGEDNAGHKTCAYDRQGRHTFDHPGVIVECNETCSCTSSCRNRVSQYPRDVPIEVFRTESSGWGVRATIDLYRGKFVGLYAGRLIPRAEADKVRGEQKSYIFDLDAIESAEDDFENTELYSVDAYYEGNWSRFINHSCEPNMVVHSVVWDTPPSMNRPYLAFFANKPIPAFTELTIDYDPSAATNVKGKRGMSKEGKACMCGTASCRGYIAV